MKRTLPGLLLMLSQAIPSFALIRTDVGGAPTPPADLKPIKIESPAAWKGAKRQVAGSALKLILHPDMVERAEGARLDANGKLVLENGQGRLLLSHFELGQPVQHLRLRLDTSGPVKAQVSVRSHRHGKIDGKNRAQDPWRPWARLTAAGTFSTLEPVSTFQIRIELTEDAAEGGAGDLSLAGLSITAWTPPAGATATPREDLPIASAVTNSRLGIIPRAKWGARRWIGSGDPEWEQGRIVGIVVHHSADPTVADVRRLGGQTMVQRIQTFHMDGRGWRDIAYHYLITPDGVIYEGVPENIEGSHMRANNRGRIGVCLLGCFDKRGDFVEAEVGREKLWQLVEHLRTKYKLGHRAVVGHQDHQPGRDCPGAYLYQELQNYRKGPQQAMHAD